jgi:hypothetical protein
MKTLAIGLSLVATTIATASAAQAGPHPTIRAMAGAKALDHLDPKTTALVIIDFQQEYFTGTMPIPDGKTALANAQRLIAFADKAGLPVFQVQHVTPAGSAVFATDGDTVAFQPGMAPRPRDTVLQKNTVSVFASTDLDQRLKAANIKTLVIAGLMTHACVAGAERCARCGAAGLPGGGSIGRLGNPRHCTRQWRHDRQGQPASRCAGGDRRHLRRRDDHVGNHAPAIALNPAFY